MKKLLITSAVFCAIANQSFAKELPQGFFLKPAATIEYSGVGLNSGYDKNYRTNNFTKQMANFENIAIGGNLRVHKNLGFNLNWYQGALVDHSVHNVGYLNYRATQKFSQFNVSALAYVPANEMIDLFAEAGLADIDGKLSYVTNSGSSVSQKSHQTLGFYGLGFQFKPCNDSDDSIRVSFQKYAGKLGLLDANYSTVRLGYVKAF